MANQAIALQARAPRGNILGPAIQQGAQMVNMMRQQETADRQAAATNQQLGIARANEAREAALHPLRVSQTQASIAASTAAADASTIERRGKLIDQYSVRAGQALTPAAYDLMLKDLDKDAPEVAAQFRASMPVENFDRNTLLRMVGSISDNFKATFGPLETEVVVSPDGTLGVARTGGFGKPGVFELEEYKLAPPGAGTSPPPAAQRPSARPPANPMAAAPMPGPNTNPVGGAPLNIQSGNMFKPASMRTGPPMGGAQPDIKSIVNEAMSSRQISQSNLQMIRDVAGPDKDAQLIQLLKAENIQIVPDAQTGMRSAMLRGGEDSAPQMQRIQDMGDYVATGRPARGKPPMQGPYPGSALVPPSVLAAQAGAEARARGEVERSLRKTPAEIEGEAEATARGTSKAKRPKESANAYNAMVAAIARYDTVISRAKALKASPGLDAIVGNIQGNLPEVIVSLQSQAAADALSDYNALIAPAGFQELQQLREASETGGALGNQSDRENVLTQDAAFTASRRQSLPKIKSSLKTFIDRMEASKQRLKDAYVREYGKTFSVRPGAIGPLAGISPLRRPGGPEYKAPSPDRGSMIDSLVKRYGN
jgi:hypothetical protein